MIYDISSSGVLCDLLGGEAVHVVDAFYIGVNA
jgi:hypothetical protein